MTDSPYLSALRAASQPPARSAFAAPSGPWVELTLWDGGTLICKTPAELWAAVRGTAHSLPRRAPAEANSLGTAPRPPANPDTDPDAWLARKREAARRLTLQELDLD